MFIRYEDIKDEKVVDVRTTLEHELTPFTKYSIPIIEIEEYLKIKKFYPMAFYIILKGILKRRRFIKTRLLMIYRNRKKALVLVCSRGRLRSPMLYFYARLLGIKCEILYRGIKPLLKSSERKKLNELL